MSAAPLATSTPLQNAIAQARMTWLDSGAGNASIQLYGGAYVGIGNAGTTLLATLQLAKPCGVVADGILTLTAANETGGDVTATGEARWARFVSAGGVGGMDFAVSVKDGTGTVGGVVLQGVAEGANKGAMLYQGGKLPPIKLQIVG